MQTKTFISESTLSQNQIQNSYPINPKQIKVKCCNREALDMCINQKCKNQSIFTCSVFNCECHKEHGLCIKVNLRNIINSIQLKVLPDQEIANFIELRIEKIIDDLSKLKEKLLEQVPKKMKYSGLHEIERRFLEHVYSEQQNKQKLSTKDSVLLWKLTAEKNQNNIFNHMKELLNKFQNQSSNSISSFTTQLNQLFQDGKNKMQVQLKKIKQNTRQIAQEIKKQQILLSSKNRQKNIQTLTNQSSIVKSIYLAMGFFDFFPEPIKNISLLYKASVNQFKMSKFYEICGDVAGTVILCESKKGKIVGGYTPFCYYQDNLTQELTPIADPSGKSFMFSLTNNDKFLLKNKQCAFNQIKNKNCISFGGGQILILDRANSNNQSQLHFDYSYHNQKYKEDDIDDYVKYNGYKSYKCTINQWQVWKVEI